MDFLTTSVLLIIIPVIQGSQDLSSFPKRTMAKETLRLDVWRFHGELPQLHRVFKSVTLDINLLSAEPYSDQNLIIYQNENRTELIETFERGQKMFGFLQKWSVWRSYKIYPFAPSFIGVETLQPYQISFKTKHVDLSLILLFVVGAALFITAKKLSRNVVAFYVGGSATGVLLSLLFLLFVFYRFLPHKRTVAIASMITGAASLNFYLIYSLLRNVAMVFRLYQKYLAIYLVTVGGLSFAACYKLGPPKDVKSKNLIQWAIQILGLLLIYNSCQIPSVSCFFICAFVVGYFLNERARKVVMKIRFRYFPPKTRFLTEDEYFDQGRAETKRALDSLRQYCSSPTCDAWKYTSRLRSPRRFAAFVSGASHLNDREVLQYDSYVAHRDAEPIDDDDDDDGGNDVDDSRAFNFDDDSEMDDDLSGFLPANVAKTRANSTVAGDRAEASLKRRVLSQSFAHFGANESPVNNNEMTSPSGENASFVSQGPMIRKRYYERFVNKR